MLGIIFDSLVFDFGLSVFPDDTYFAYMTNFLRMDNAFASTTERMENRVAAAIQRLTDAAEN